MLGSPDSAAFALAGLEYWEHRQWVAALQSRAAQLSPRHTLSSWASGATASRTI